MDTKRLALAFVLSAAVLIAWSILFPPPKSPKPAAVAQPTRVVATEARPTPAASPAAEAAAPVEQTTEPVFASSATELVVQTDVYTARLSNHGGELLSYRLNRYLDGEQKPLDLVRRDAAFPGRTLGLDPTDPFMARAKQALYKVERETSGKETRIRFIYREADGNGIVRTYTFRPGYVVSLRVEREGRNGLPVGVVLGPGLGNPSAEELRGQFTKPGSPVVLDAGGSVSRKAKDSLKEPWLAGKGLRAVGLEDNYFLAVFLPGAAADAAVRPVEIMHPGVDGKAPEKVGESEVVLTAAGRLDADIFLGPKVLRLLEATRPGMEKLIDYGMFAILVKPLLWVLKGINAEVGNWGVSIILITILIKLVLYPLTHKQLVSMKKMSQVQPKVETLRAKWAPKIKQDPQARMKMNEEMMGLYKTEGINPAGGCLPLILQLPILFAFYSLLAHAIELRHAPFALWIHDLSAKDPYFVTPILMTISMWVQQQMTPPTGDAAMRKMMAVLPFVFGFMFKDTPSGLVIYWLVQNILTIVQQMILNRFTDLGPKSMKRGK